MWILRQFLSLISQEQEPHCCDMLLLGKSLQAPNCSIFELFNLVLVKPKRNLKIVIY